MVMSLIASYNGNDCTTRNIQLRTVCWLLLFINQLHLNLKYLPGHKF